MTLIALLFTFCYASNVTMYTTPEVFAPVITVSVEAKKLPKKKKNPAVKKEVSPIGIVNP